MGVKIIWNIPQGALLLYHKCAWNAHATGSAFPLVDYKGVTKSLENEKFACHKSKMVVKLLQKSTYGT